MIAVVAQVPGCQVITADADTRDGRDTYVAQWMRDGREAVLGRRAPSTATCTRRMPETVTPRAATGLRATVAARLRVPALPVLPVAASSEQS